MSVTIRPMPNGGDQRKSLASQLDRFDSILDGLDEALQGAVADAVKEAVSTAVTEAVRATLIEIASNPQIISLLRGGAAANAEQQAEPRPSLLGRVCQGLSNAWRWSLRKVCALPSVIASSVVQIRDGVVQAYRRANAVWALKRPLVFALLIGVVVGIVSYASSPWLAGIVSGISATGAALGMQLAMFTRRIFSAFPARC